ncbi:MAG: cell envelope integrity protein TolA [Bacteroidales bacterium]|nr:cell envelope integrity protein TolA [Bacteroidales bacterium]MDD4361011.1 cell envelope integrity protein TolA [Bacteroidales bacterium]MDD4430843.1 cell envelope integrity protein TolA [Bacteroidales bacterium]
MTAKKNDIIAIAGTILVHILLIVFLIFFGYTAHIPDSEEGVTVNFGNIDLAAGTFEPRGESLSNQQTQPQSPAERNPTQSNQEELISQEDESIALEAARKRQEEEAARKLEEERIRQEQERKAAEIREQAAQAFGSKQGQQNESQGNEEEEEIGNQGDIQGSTESANIIGSGSGYGNFSLDGRSINGSLPRPSYSIEAEGVVVVRITVNNAGTVISASIDLQGTDTDNAELRNAALNAAKKAKFNAIEGTRNQTGTITYRFQLR